MTEMTVPDTLLQFDANRLTVTDLLLMDKGDKTGNIAYHAQVFAKACVTCPKAWGEPNETKTFSELLWLDYLDAQAEMREATVTANQAAPETLTGVRFDFSRVKARDVGRFLKAAQIGDARTMVELLPAFTQAVPQLADPTQQDGYLTLPYYPVFLPLVRMAVSEANDGQKKGRKPSSSG